MLSENSKADAKASGSASTGPRFSIPAGREGTATGSVADTTVVATIGTAAGCPAPISGTADPASRPAGGNDSVPVRSIRSGVSRSARGSAAGTAGLSPSIAARSSWICMWRSAFSRTRAASCVKRTLTCSMTFPSLSEDRSFLSAKVRGAFSNRGCGPGPPTIGLQGRAHLAAGAAAAGAGPNWHRSVPG